MEGINSGDTAWVLMATTRVLMMTPALAFFYEGMVRKKDVLSTLNASFIMMALISIQWLLFGFTLAFGNSKGSPATHRHRGRRHYLRAARGGGDPHPHRRTRARRADVPG